MLHATQLLSQGWQWQRIYPEVYPDWHRLRFVDRSYRKHKLKRAVAARRRRLDNEPGGSQAAEPETAATPA